ncbi:MAG: energy-coupling factor transporter transmembrane protein EcfT [Christensenellaceae bacterium]|nr:energy-coupling factor transporter transmembrane protein EcfT [Christensenellaceae bacterium]
MIKNMTLGQYFPGNSIIHRMDPRMKLILTILLIVVVFFCQSVWSYCAVVALLLFAILLSRVGIKYVLKGIKPLWFILVFTFVLNVFFSTGGNVVFEWEFIKITDKGLMNAINIALRLILLITTTTVMTLTTSPMEITDAIERLLKPLKWVRFPVHEMALMMSIALRFIPTLMDETDRIMKAQTARGASFDEGGLIGKAKSMVPILVPLFVSAFKRADELALAMESRCYNGGDHRTRMKVLHLKLKDWVAFLVTALLGAAIIVWG